VPSYPRQVGGLGDGVRAQHGSARISDYRHQRHHCRKCDYLARLAVAARRMTAPPEHHIIMAQRYSDWAREQVDRAGRTLNPKARNDRLALAEYYSQLAEQELAAAKQRLDPAVKLPAATPSAAIPAGNLISTVPSQPIASG